MMIKIIACIDGSDYAGSVCQLAAWAHDRSGLPISLLHVAAPHCEVVAEGDWSGQIGLGAKSGLLHELTERDEAHGKLEQKKGQLMLDHAKEKLAAQGVPSPEVLHRRGALVDTIVELEPHLELLIMGKRGEHHQATSDHLGSNLERVARSIHKPLLVATKKLKPIEKLLIAYDGSPSANKAVAYVSHQPLFKGLECHLLSVGETTPEAQSMLAHAEQTLKAGGFTVHAHLKQGKPVEAIVAEYSANHGIDLLVIGAYGHSKIRSLILGSTTSALIRSTHLPIMLFR